MRGKPTVSEPAGKTIGITPADAGKTPLWLYVSGLFWDHPRGCGENENLFLQIPTVAGSPPRMRGKRIDAGQLIAVTRITPADAGKTGVRSVSFLGGKDHPRGCGKNSRMGKKDSRGLGSPPRMRGKQGFPFANCVRRRITPADAGKTLSAGTGGFLRRDHPRGCGENSPQRRLNAPQGGSPPRMRGKLFICKGCNLKRRIPPADAGKTTQRIGINPCAEDHPRGCGENEDDSLRQAYTSGSPPRMRGKPKLR